jgi:4,5-DOPA dioxygenase extradiol
MEKPMPAIFFGHGNPMNALGGNDFTNAWSACGAAIPKPSAVLSISAHWYVAGTFVTAMSAPRTIHDFGGFPTDLYRIIYPAPGKPELALRVAELLVPLSVGQDQAWGLDHGTWSVLCHVFPEADIPIVQLSIDRTKAPAFHYEVAEKLAPLRNEGVLVIGSGNLVHNLQAYSWGNRPVEPLDWAVRFEVDQWGRMRCRRCPARIIFCRCFMLLHFKNRMRLSAFRSRASTVVPFRCWQSR